MTPTFITVEFDINTADTLAAINLLVQEASSKKVIKIEDIGIRDAHGRRMAYMLCSTPTP